MLTLYINSNKYVLANPSLLLHSSALHTLNHGDEVIDVLLLHSSALHTLNHGDEVIPVQFWLLVFG